LAKLISAEIEAFSWSTLTLCTLDWHGSHR